MEDRSASLLRGEFEYKLCDDRENDQHLSWVLWSHEPTYREQTSTAATAGSHRYVLVPGDVQTG